VVVVVPIEKAREQFLDSLNSQQNDKVSAILVNDRGQVLTSTRLKPGTSLLEQLDPSVRQGFENLIADHSEPVSSVISEPFAMGGEQSQPLILSAAQLEVPSGRHWTVIIGTPLADAETVVNQLFGRALVGALFVSISVAAILASTSFFLIRARVRLERTRHEMLTRELEQARQIQLAWLPDLKSVPAGIEVSAINLPANHISGDFYNWFPLPAIMQKTGVTGAAGDNTEISSNKTAIVIGDVTGHGMAAAFLMATTQLLIRMNMTRFQDAGRCLREVNKQLCMQSGGGFRGQFVTMLVLVLDTQNNRVQVASAGHPAPLIEADGKLHALEIEPQLVLGVNPDEDYHAKSFPLDAGSSVLLYTDGVVEAEGTAAGGGGQYGVDRLIKIFQARPEIAPAERIRAILEDVKKFGGSGDLHDDVTLVAVRTVPVEAGTLQ
jgi:serine phosphatase RsbU (regulator of sigma subunit)